jgi:hypothetical protein
LTGVSIAFGYARENTFQFGGRIEVRARPHSVTLSKYSSNVTL